MGNKEMENHLSEEKYQKTKKKLMVIAIVVFGIGLLIGLGLITKGLIKRSEINLRFSEENKKVILEQMENEKEKISIKKKELEDKIEPIKNQIKDLERVKFDGFNEAYYERQDKISELIKSKMEDENTIDLLDDVLYRGYCSSVAENNEITAKYCSLHAEFEYINSVAHKSSDFADCTSFYVFGGFVIIVFSMISIPIYSSAKARDIAAFTMQQGIPLMEEGVEKITSIHKKMVKEMAPVYGEVAKEVAKGVEKGKRQGQKTKCSGCGAPVEDDTDTCRYCKSKY